MVNWRYKAGSCIYNTFKDNKYPAVVNFPSNYMKQDFIDWYMACFALGDSTASANGYWQTGVWNPTVNRCLAYFKG